MHLVSDPQKYLAAVQNQNVPFFHTACGSAEPLAKLTTDPKLVSCLQCGALISKALAAAPAPAPASVPEPEPFDEPIDDDLDDMDDIDDSFGKEDTFAVPGVEPEVSPLAAFQPMLESVFAGFDADEDWKRWTMTPQTDPQGSEGMLIGDWDPRSILNSEQAAFITSLSEMSSLVGLEGLSSRVLTLLHQIAVSSYDEDANPRRFPKTKASSGAIVIDGSIAEEGAAFVEASEVAVQDQLPRLTEEVHTIPVESPDGEE